MSARDVRRGLERARRVVWRMRDLARDFRDVEIAELGKDHVAARRLASYVEGMNRAADQISREIIDGPKPRRRRRK